MDKIITLPDRPDLQIVGVEWRSGEETVGFVAVQHKKTGLWHVFVGPAKDKADPVQDAIHIARWGAKLTQEEAHVFFKYMPVQKYTMEELY